MTRLRVRWRWQSRVVGTSLDVGWSTDDAGWAQCKRGNPGETRAAPRREFRGLRVYGGITQNESNIFVWQAALQCKASCHSGFQEASTSPLLSNFMSFCPYSIVENRAGGRSTILVAFVRLALSPLPEYWNSFSFIIDQSLNPSPTPSTATGRRLAFVRKASRRNDQSADSPSRLCTMGSQRTSLLLKNKKALPTTHFTVPRPQLLLLSALFHSFRRPSVWSPTSFLAEPCGKGIVSA